jgi:alpha-mannosidase
MLKHRTLTEARIERVIARLEPLVQGPIAPVLVEALHVHGEPISHGEAVAGTFVPFEVGALWGAAWETTWFRVRATVPGEWAGRQVLALFELGYLRNEGFTCEGLIWRDGKPERAINVHRNDIPVAASAKGGETVEFFVEAAANPMSAQGNVGDNPRLMPDFGGKPLFLLRRAELACVDREAERFLLDIRFAYEAMLALPEDSPRRGQLLYALNAAANRFDENDRSTITPARAELAGVMAARNGDSAHRISAIGHAHIDTAWLWPLREAMRKCARTFSTALAYMKEYPDYVFGCSQAVQYAWMKEVYPDIFEGIREAVRRGQWEPIGSMWVETDCNLASGESITRQILKGKRFFQEELGVETKDVWIPDVFGYAASMPQILAKAGIPWFLTQKISWNQFNKFPHHTFLWEGIDGTRAFTHFLPADTYNATMSPKELVFNVTNFREHDRATRSLYAYGHGDGGGGPTRRMLEHARRAKDFEGLPKVELEQVSSFFPKAIADAKDLPVWSGELYLELHRGTLTTQARNKRGNRKSELLLRDAEALDALAGALGLAAKDAPRENLPHAAYDVIGRGVAAPDNAADLDRAWKLVLLNQFHDIIPGSSIHWVYRDSDRDYETIAALGERVAGHSLAALAEGIDTGKAARPVLAFNPLGWARGEVAELPGAGPRWVEVPSCGYAVLDADGEAALPASVAPVEAVRSGDSIVLSNGRVRVGIDADGLLSEVFDLRCGRHALAEGARANLLQLHPDYPNKWDAWDVDVFHREVGVDLTAAERVELIESGPLRAVVLVERRFGASHLVQRIVLRAGSSRIDFENEIDWRERHRLLKVAFPVRVRSSRATYEIQYGSIERPTHFNTSWDMARFEVCAQKWADLSEGDYGVALLNDCKYGHDTVGNVLRISLLRAPTSPDPEADQGAHRFTYSMLPHAGDFRSGGVVEEAHALNSPVRFAGTAPRKGSLPAAQSFVACDRPGMVLEAVKAPEEGAGVVVRFHEAFSTRGPATVRVGFPFRKVWIADLLERPVRELTAAADGSVGIEVGPFEIVTLRFER